MTKYRKNKARRARGQRMRLWGARSGYSTGTTTREAGGDVVISGKTWFDVGYNASYSFNQIAVTPNLFSRLDDFRLLYEQYRWEAMAFTALPICSSTYPVAMAFEAGDSIPAASGWNYQQVVALGNSVTCFTGQTMPVTLTVRRGQLSSGRVWYATNNTNGSPGAFYIGGPSSTAVACAVEIAYRIRFHQPVFDSKEGTSAPPTRREDQESKGTFGVAVPLVSDLEMPSTVPTTVPTSVYPSSEEMRSRGIRAIATRSGKG